MLAVGVDILEVERMTRGVARFGDRFCDRFFTAREQEQCNGRATSLAGRFAVKEAVGKALGTGIGDVGWKEIEIVSDDSGRPTLALHGAAARLAAERGLGEWAISLSHTGTHAVGMAVALALDGAFLSTIVPTDITRDTDDDRRDATREDKR
ncbi:MAG: holo-ACP synthase [Candidatus Promineofilum sp.]|uniref:holo-ACP synthase n=1 Tax=Promineifilum sp. TaxID=2664178 RepID=UPI002411AD2A|nr:holo-ACP synthase [Promineifilum sp.]MCO5178654.1 holo-ACP synthase [Promineifilum sp.]